MDKMSIFIKEILQTKNNKIKRVKLNFNEFKFV
jgi:hypothetical protein